jgi:hypothetical protein
MAAIADLLPPEAHQPHDPTPDELRHSYPAGWNPDKSPDDPDDGDV